MKIVYVTPTETHCVYMGKDLLGEICFQIGKAKSTVSKPTGANLLDWIFYDEIYKRFEDASQVLRTRNLISHDEMVSANETFNVGSK